MYGAGNPHAFIVSAGRAVLSIAFGFAYASAWKFTASARCCKTGLVIAPRPAATSTAEAYAK